MYGGEGNLSERKSVSPDTGTTSSIEKYFWENGNIVKIDFYGKDGAITLESFFKYDSAKNYQYGLPNFLKQPSSWSRNNIIESGSMDYTGSIYWACNPCRTSYTYNLDILLPNENPSFRLFLFPVKKKERLGEVALLEYFF